MLSKHIGIKRISRITTKGRCINSTFIFVIGFIVLLQGCPIETNVLKGFGISPQGVPLDWSKLGDFYTEVGSMTNSAVMWNGGWRDDLADGTDAGTIPKGAADIVQNSKNYRFTPISVFGWRSGDTIYLNVPGDETNYWTNTTARSLFKNMLVDYVDTYQPPFIFIGNENSAYYEQNPTDYENWINFYNDAYDAIKTASPGTKVGTIFNFEHIAGSGKLNGWTKTYWEAIDLHDLSKVDIVGVTLYPFLNYASADEVPVSYLDPLVSRISSKPIAITETGWPAEDFGNLDLPWEESEQAQLTYLSKLEVMLEGNNISTVNWLFLYPMEDPGGSPSDWELFGSISIRDSSGNKRPVYDPWLTYSP
jgi:hypothetical protein